MIVTHSSLNMFAACKRSYFYAYVCGRTKRTTSNALAFGRAWHKALEAWWLAAPDNRLQAACNVLYEKQEGINEEDLAKLLAMLQWYNPPVDEYEVLQVENLFSTAIVNPESGRPMMRASLSGRIDGVVKRKSDGTIWVLEHKTCGEPVIGFGPFWQRLQLDQQIAIYVKVAGAIGALYDVARKPTIKFCGKDADVDAYRMRAAEQRAACLDEWYQFRAIEKQPEDLFESQVDLWQNAHTIADCERQSRWPRNGAACRNNYGTCQYLDVCTGAANIDDDEIFRSKSDQHEELAA